MSFADVKYIYLLLVELSIPFFPCLVSDSDCSGHCCRHTQSACVCSYKNSPLPRYVVKIFMYWNWKKKTNITLLGYFWWAATCASPRPRCGRLAAWWESTTLRLVSGWPEFRLLEGSGLIIWRSRTLTSHYVAKGRSPENACASLSSSRRHEDRLWIFFFAGRLVQVVKRWMYPWCVFFAFFFFFFALPGNNGIDNSNSCRAYCISPLLRSL